MRISRNGKDNSRHDSKTNLMKLKIKTLRICGGTKRNEIVFTFQVNSRFIWTKLRLSMALITCESSSVKSTTGDTLGAAFVTSWCHVMSVLATRFISIDPTCNHDKGELISKSI